MAISSSLLALSSLLDSWGPGFTVFFWCPDVLSRVHPIPVAELWLGQKSGPEGVMHLGLQFSSGLRDPVLN